MRFLLLRLPLLMAAVIFAVAKVSAQSSEETEFVERFIDAAIERTNYQVRYDGSYRQIRYPGGDVPGDVGVCTDLIIRSFRAVGIDLQKEVHEDMSANFSQYPRVWGLGKPDPNIDHRRVLNMQAFFRRRGHELPVTDDPRDYLPGDLVTWTLPEDRTHIGIVIMKRANGSNRPLIVHNIGEGPATEDILFKYPITGHYRYYGANH